jgi:hypothetical protein
VPRTEKYSEKVFLCIRNTVRRSSDVSETQWGGLRYKNLVIGRIMNTAANYSSDIFIWAVVTLSFIRRLVAGFEARRYVCLSFQCVRKK